MKNQKKAPEYTFEERKANLFSPVEPGSKTYIVSQFEGESYLCVQPILKLLNNHEAPEVIKTLDKAIIDLSMYYLNDRNLAGDTAYTVMIMRDLRNAMMSGMGYFTFDENLEQEPEQEPEQKCLKRA